MNSKTTYKHSGNFTFSDLALFATINFVITLVIATLYAYINLYSPIIGYLSIIFVAIAGCSLGWYLAKFLIKFKIRNVKVARISCLAFGLLLVLSSWVIWLYAFLRREHIAVDFNTFVSDWHSLINLVYEINSEGAWSVKDYTPTGIVLWGFWAVEALILFIPSFLFVESALDTPFCERCSKWCKERIDVLRFKSSKELEERIKRGDYSFLKDAIRADENDSQYISVDYLGCQTCQQLNFIRVFDVNVSRNSEGQRSEDKKVIIGLTQVDASTAQHFEK